MEVSGHRTIGRPTLRWWSDVIRKKQQGERSTARSTIPENDAPTPNMEKAE